MIQLYFLSILCNGLTGYILFAGDESQADEKAIVFHNNPTFHLVLGILSAVTGILKILSPTVLENSSPGGGFLILGDLIPAAAGIVAGFMLIFGIYRKDNSQSGSSSMDVLGSSLLGLRKPIGIGLLGVAVLHFLFAKIMFL
jgi:hypothetical protein